MNICIRTYMFVVFFFLFQHLWVCCHGTLPPGDHWFTQKDSSGTERPIIVHVPPKLSSEQPPLFIMLHGMGENYPSNFMFETSFPNDTDTFGFVSVWPLGSPSYSVSVFGHTWNAGSDCCFSDHDDLDFLRNAVAATLGMTPIDTSRIYAVGFSAGGCMSGRLACEGLSVAGATQSVRLAAFASAEGPTVDFTCVPAQPVAALLFRGTADPVFPYEDSPIYPSAAADFAGWAKRNGCTGEPKETYRHVWTSVETYSNCSGSTETALATVTLGGHSWPPADINPNAFLARWLLRYKSSQ